MNYHTPQESRTVKKPEFLVLNGALVVPQKIYTKREYPKFSDDMVKLTSQDGRNIFLPISKLANIGGM